MKFRKPFKDSKVGKILTSPIVKGVLTKLPFGVGSLVSEVVNSTTTPEGNINREQLIHSLIKMGIYAILLYMVFSDKLDLSTAEDYKEFLQN